MNRFWIASLAGSTLVAMMACDTRECVYYNDCGSGSMCTDDGVCVELPDVAEQEVSNVGWGQGDPDTAPIAAPDVYATQGTAAELVSTIGAAGQLLIGTGTTPTLTVWRNDRGAGLFDVDIRIDFEGDGARFGLIAAYIPALDSAGSVTDLGPVEDAYLVSCSGDASGAGMNFDFDVPAESGEVIVTPTDDGRVQIEIDAVVPGAPADFSGVVILDLNEEVNVQP